MTVESAETVTDYVEDVLIGGGVSVSNVTINGQPGNMINLQCGFFESNMSYMPIEDGLVLSSGQVFGENFDGDPIIVGEQTSIQVGNPSGGDPDLESISGENINDQAVLEFDFIPQGDTLRFNYVFGSEEYPEFVNSFNDAFGFFLSGPGISGPFSSPVEFPDGSVNIALIPDTNIPVTIDNVNNGNFNCPGPPTGPCMNCEFYVDNCDIATEAMDGMTTVLEAFALVQCGATYHIKLAIGDAVDSGFDSAVFLESGSFQSQANELEINPPLNSVDIPLVELAQGCDTASLYLNRLCDGDTAFYQITYLNNDTTANPIEDVEPLPTEFMLLPGNSDTLFPLITVIDTIAEGVEYFCPIISISESPDGPFVVVDTVCIQVIDAYQFPLNVTPEVLRCPESIPVFPVTAGGQVENPYDLYWIFEGDTVSMDNPFTGPAPPNFGDSIFYDLYAVDLCGATSLPTQTYSTNQVPGPPVPTISQPGSFCPGLNYQLQVNVAGGTWPLSFDWFSPTGAAPSDSSRLVITPDIGPFNADEDSRTYFTTVTDNCNPGRVGTDSIVVQFPEPLQLEFFSDSVICTTEELDLLTTSSGGYDPHTISYEIDGIVEVTTETDPTTGAGIAYGFVYDGNDPSNNVYEIAVRLDDQCTLAGGGQEFTVASYYTDSALVEVEVSSLFCIVPNVITPNDDGMNDRFEAIEMINKGGRMYIYNRWGNEIVSTANYFFEFTDEPEGTYYYVIDFAEGETKKGSFTILR